MTIDDRLEYKEHARSVITKAMGIWNPFRIHCPGVGSTITKTSLVMQNIIPKPIILCFPGMGENIMNDLHTFQSNFNWPMLQNCLSQSIRAAERLMGITPEDIWKKETVWKKVKCQISSESKAMALTWFQLPMMKQLNYKGAPAMFFRTIKKISKANCPERWPAAILIESNNRLCQ